MFKPELAGRLTTPNSSLYDGLSANQELTLINLAVQTTADTLGLGDIMVKTSAGTHKGRYVSYTNTFFRDLHQVLIAGKAHANWFDG